MPVVHAGRAVGLALLCALATAGCTTGGPEPTPAPAASAKAGLGDAPSPPRVNATKKVAEANFTSPSKNIGCYLEADSARCDIVKKQWTPPPKPADCELGWGNAVTVAKNEMATFTCAGDTVLGSTEVLPYGQSLRSGDFVCDSTETSIRCSNIKTSHGFTLSVQQHNVF